MSETDKPTGRADEPTPKPAASGHRDSDLREHLKSGGTWRRLFFMIIVVLLYGVSRVVTAVVVLLQFGWVLFSGRTNPSLTRFGRSLALYACQSLLYLTYNTEVRPFPFDVDWPAPESGIEPQGESLPGADRDATA